MKSKTPFFWRIYQLFFCYTLLVYGLSYFAFSGHWLVGFIMMSLPLVLMVHLFSALFLLIRKSRKVWLPGLALMLSFPFWARTYGWGKSNEPENSTFKQLKVLSYNVMAFDVDNFYNDKDQPANSQKLIEWGIKVDADVKCFQEFFNHRDLRDFQTYSRFQKAGYPYYTALKPKAYLTKDHTNGLVIMSKYPIIQHEEREFSNQNGIIYADIKVKEDTIRVINVHLRSMIVRFGGVKAAYKEKNFKHGRYELFGVLKKLQGGFVHHADEVQIVTQWIEQSPHPVLVCGDFNEIPYCYAYGQLRQRLSNAFEEAGSGFGFTYRKSPKYIRIDNQFYDPQHIEVLDFHTRNDVKFSDHYPIIGHYKLL